MSMNYDKYKERERRILALKMIIKANGNNASEYARQLGMSRSSISKMLMGEQRVSNRALGLNNDKRI